MVERFWDHRRSRRHRWRLAGLVSLVALGLAAAVFCGRGPLGIRSAAALPQPGPPAIAGIEPPQVRAAAPGPGELQLGAYVTVIDEINLLGNQFGAEFFLWTRWSGPAQTNPSDRLAVLNAPSDNNIDRFELLERRQLGDVSWSLYKVRCRVAMPWRLNDYPLDRHYLQIKIGIENPLVDGLTFKADKDQSSIDPEFLLYDWSISPLRIDVSGLSINSHLGLPGQAGKGVASSPIVELSLPIRRRIELALLSSFLGNFLAIGLCILALIIRDSRDDLILGAVFSAAGNSIFLAQLLPASALSGFAGQFQVIIYVGIVYVVMADELLDRVFNSQAESLLRYLRPALLPSYVLATVISVYHILPPNLYS